MDEEQRIARLEEKLEDMLETVKDNNKRLQSIQRSLRWSFWGRILIWVIVLVLPFILLGPFLRALVPGLPGTDSKSVFGLPSENQIQGLLNAYKNSSSSGSSNNSAH